MSWLSNIWKRFKAWCYADNRVQTQIHALSRYAVIEKYKGWAGDGNVRVADKDYSVLSKFWLMRGYYNYYIKVLNGLKISGWEEKFDCDNFAGLYKEVLSACHRVSTMSKSEGVAIGVVWYKTDSGGGHAINTAIVDDDRVIFIEPQTGLEKTLSDTELNNIFFVLF